MQAGFPVLLVEDNPDDAFFVKRAFASLALNNPLMSVEDGAQAIAYLRGQGKYADRKVYPVPGLVIADLSMPHLTGFDLIQWMREDSDTKRIPIIVLSASDLQRDVNRAYELGANAYMVKPTGYVALERLIRSIAEFCDASEKPTAIERLNCEDSFRNRAKPTWQIR